MPFKLLRKFREDSDGVAAIEFALIFPIIAVVVAGVVDMGASSKMDRDIKRAAASVVHIATKSGNFNGDVQEEIRSGMAAILGPQASNAYRVRVDGVVNNGGTIEQEWTWNFGNGASAPDYNAYLGTTLSEGRGGIVVTIERDYSAFFHAGTDGAFTLSATHASGALRSSKMVFYDEPAPGQPPVTTGIAINIPFSGGPQIEEAPSFTWP